MMEECEEERFAVGITQGLAAVDRYHFEKALREEPFPLKLTDNGIAFRCEEGEASVEDDRIKILDEIG